MKIKPPKKPRKPSKNFEAAQAARQETKAKAVTEKGDVKVYLDDERNSPEDWTLCRTPAEFWNVVKGPAKDRITQISLDWYLGHNVIANGVVIAKGLADMMRANKDAFPRLKRINLHSSDRDKAMEMAQVLKPLVHDMNGMRFRIDIGGTNG